MPRTLLAGVAVAVAACAAGAGQAPRLHNATAPADSVAIRQGYCQPGAPDQPSDCGAIGEASAERTICTDEATTGSHITRTVCRSEDDADDEHDAAMTWIKTPKPDVTKNGVRVNPAEDPFQRVHYPGSRH